MLRGNAGGVTFTHPLPTEGELAIGRGTDADLRVNVPDASRLHATVQIAGSSLRMRDLGSTNGTFARGARLASQVWTELRVGEPFAFGTCLLVIQHARENQDCERLTGPALFEDRVRAELSTFERTRRPFGVCIFEAEGQSDWLSAFASILAPDDVIAVLGTTTTAILLVGRTPNEVTQVSSELEAYMARRYLQPTLHCAFCPETGTTLEQLLPRLQTRHDTSMDTVRPIRIVDRSAAMSRVLALVGQVAPTSTSVLVYGATGTGKDVLAHEIHERSRRRNGPFVALNCAALPEQLLESELFGYEKGAFTGAVSAKPGQFELAHGGTLFLDEIGEMPMHAQAKLLRAVEDRAVLRLGGTKITPVDVRIISATNRDLRQRIEEGSFRADLFFRLNAFSITLPLLRERKDEIPQFVDHFVSCAASAHGKAPPVVDPEAMKRLIEYPWPGNIRELRSVVERAVLFARHGFIRVEHLPDEMVAETMADNRALEDSRSTRRTPRFRAGFVEDDVEVTVTTMPRVSPPPSSGSMASTPPASAPPGATPPSLSLDELLAVIEGHEGPMRTALLTREIVSQALDRCAGNQSQAARLLGVSRHTIIDRIEKFRLARPRKPGSSK